MNYKKTQYGVFTTSLIIAIQIILLISYKSNLNTIPLPVFLILSLFFLITLLVFYKLTITIDKDKITAVFGIGLLSKSILLNEIDLNTIEKIKSSWLYGIGIRITPKGWLWNVKLGEAIYFQTKNKTKTFLVGTDDFKNIAEILKQKIKILGQTQE